MLSNSFMFILKGLCIVVPGAFSFYYFFKSIKILWDLLVIIKRGFKVNGKIIDFKISNDDEFGIKYTPIVSFQTHLGQKIEATAPFDTSEEDELCKSVTVIYNPGKPESFYIAPAPIRDIALFVIIALFAGFLSILSFSLFLLYCIGDL